MKKGEKHIGGRGENENEKAPLETMSRVIFAIYTQSLLEFFRKS